jgi:hypothetical protein
MGISVVKEGRKLGQAAPPGCKRKIKGHREGCNDFDRRRCGLRKV